ncbi:LppA family lipoprotein [Actinophytocola sp.]|uniref:LppA family lipoprotein n=1 Tax=Actinophytocola sp. TaxID=1872138 RepID=UPI002D801BAB|nr:LppA family lipoprotein [Actinophytocola sp.]HET9143227.1 LppA family lipoprotein [Actinophytocola sp.]
MDRDTRRQQQFQEMMGRPDIEQAAQRYDEMTATLRQRLEAEAGIGAWYEDTKSGGNAGCRQFPDVEGDDKQSRGLRMWLSDGKVPDDTWARAVEIAQDVAGQYGFETPVRVIVDVPGDHEVTTADPLGADLILGTKLSTVLQVRTGCHLTAEAHQRGTPTIPEFG